MKEGTTVKVSKTTRLFIDTVKIIPEETCDHAIFRALKRLKESDQKTVYF